jgi:hypothetical protein
MIRVIGDAPERCSKNPVFTNAIEIRMAFVSNCLTFDALKLN